MMSNEENDPLGELYADKQSLDRERLASVLRGLIRIDKDSGAPIFEEDYHNLTGPEQFVSLLLYRRATVALGEINEEEVGVSAEEVGRQTRVSDSTVRNYPGELAFIESDRSKGGYYISGYGVEQAIDFLKSDGD